MGDFTTCPSGSAGVSGAAADAAAAVAGAAAVMLVAWGIVIPAVCTVLPARLIRTFSSPSVISSSAIPDSCTRSISFLSFLKSICGRPLFPGCIGQRALQRVLIALRPEPADHPDGLVAEIGMAPEGLACVHVGKMHLDIGNAHRGERIPQRHAGMGKGGWIDDDE